MSLPTKLKNISNIIRYKRPSWYYSYHQWGHHGKIHWVAFGVSASAIIVSVVNFSLQSNNPSFTALASTTVVSQVINGGTLSLSSPGSTTLSSVTVTTASQNSTGSIGTLTVTDTRGSYAGWSLVDTATNFTFINAPVKVSGSNSTLSSGGVYTGSSGGTYTVTINGAGGVGTATFNVSGLGTQGTTTTGSGVAIGSLGVTVGFAAATYSVGDSWTVRVDEIPVTGLTQTPNTITTNSGSSTGVTAGSAHTFSSTSDPTSIMNASAGNGNGQYTDNPDLQLTIPANSFANTYSATITETLS